MSIKTYLNKLVWNFPCCDSSVNSPEYSINRVSLSNNSAGFSVTVSLFVAPRPLPGNVITLTGLNLRYCPITFPPQDVVDQGVQSILQYLRGALARRPVSEKKILPAGE